MTIQKLIDKHIRADVADWFDCCGGEVPLDRDPVLLAIAEGKH